MKPLVYIETTIPSFYCDKRTDPASVARREWTRTWWDERRQRYEVVTSPPVLAELDAAPEPKRSDALKVLEAIPILPVPDGIEEIVEFYVQKKLMPRDPTGDAMHLALASYYKCDFLLTWNCRNLANAEKFHHIIVVNNLLNLHIPILTTPEQLLGE